MLIGVKMGRHLNQEVKDKISKSRTGTTHSKETLLKMSLSHMGNSPSAETRAKMSKSRMGEKNHMYGKHNSPEARAKMSLYHRGKTLSVEHRDKISKSLIGNTRSAGSSNHNVPLSAEAKARIGAANSKKMKEKWQNPEFKDRRVMAIVKGNKIQPNIPELKVNAILDELYPGEWKYTGDGEIVMGGRNPDFTNIDGQKEIIEVFGDYWHRGQESQETIGHYKEYGFRCLVIWEAELNDIDLVTKRIKAWC